MALDSRAALFEALLGAKRVLLTGPVNPDGDSLGACLALQQVLQRRGIETDVAGQPADRYGWMPGIDTVVPDAEVDTSYDAVVVLDGDRHRLVPTTAAAFAAASVRAIIDHHASTTIDGYTHPWVEAGATSTCEMLYAFFCERGERVDGTLATLLYTGAIFDTGAFRYSNTTPATHAMAAELLTVGIDHSSICTRVLMERTQGGLRCAGHVFSEASFYADGLLAVGRISLDDQARFNLIAGDLEGVVDALVHVSGVAVAVLLIQKTETTIKASLRSRGRVDVGQVAQGLAPTGGGHRKAAGATLAGPMGFAESHVVGVLSAALGVGQAVSAK